MSSNTNFQSNITFKGKFDVSEILASIKQMRQQISQTSNIELLGDLDKQISKVEGLGKTIQAQIGKGFSSQKEFSSFQSNINKLELEFEKLGNSFDDINVDNLSKSLKAAEKDIKDLESKAKKAAQAFASSFKASANNITGAESIKKEIIEAAKEGKSLEETQKRIEEIYENQTKTLAAQTKELKTQRDAAAKNLTNAQNSFANVGLRTTNFKNSNDSAISTEQFTKIRAEFEKIASQSTNAQDAVNKFSKALAKQNIEFKNATTIEGKFSQAISNYGSMVAPAEAALSGLNKQISDNERQMDKLANQQGQMQTALSNEANKYSAAASAVNAYATAENSLEQTQKKLRESSTQAGNAIGTLRDSMNGAVISLREGSVATEDSVNSQKKMNSTLDQLKNRIGYLLSFGNAYYQLRNIIRQTFTDVQKLDKAFASIAMVTNKTVQDLWSTYSDYSEMANRLGQSTESAIKASALFYQQGLDTAEALRLTEDTMKLATLAGADFETATQQMTAALRGFHMEMDEGAKVTDVYSELAANAAADVNGIAYAMSKTASIAANAGMDFETTAAFLTNMIETTQEAPENIGTAMKTIIARFTELKENVSEADSEFDDLDYNKVDKALKSVGISLKDAQGQFRDLDDVFLELSSKWDTLDRNTQRYIATIAAGSRQQSRFIAMMEDYDRTMQLVEVAQDSAGRSSEQFAKYQDTVEYKINQLKNSWEQFRSSLIDSDIFKDIIDGLTGILDKINQLDGSQLIALGATFVLFGRNMVQSIITGITSSTTTLSNAISLVTEKAMNLASKKKASSFEKTITLKVDEKGKTELKSLEQSLTAYKEKIEEINNTTIRTTVQGENFVDLNLDDMGIDLDQIIAKFEEIHAQGGAVEITFDNWIMSTQDLNMLSEEERQKVAEIAKEYLIAQNGVKQMEGEVEQLNSKMAAQQKYAEGMGKRIGSSVASSFSTAFTTTLTVAFTADDPLDILKANAMSFAMTTVPFVVNKVIEGAMAGAAQMALIEAAATAGISVLVTLVVTGIGMAIKYFSNLKDEATQLKDQLKDAQEISKEMSEHTSKLRDEAQEAKETKENISKIKEEYEELNKKSVKTAEEQERYNELVDEIRTEFPEIVTAYNEITGELQVQKDLWDDIIERYSILEKRKQREAYFGKTIDTINAENQEKIENDIKKTKGITYVDKDKNNLNYNGLNVSIGRQIELILQDNQEKDFTEIFKIVKEMFEQNEIKVNWEEMAENMGIKDFDENDNNMTEQLMKILQYTSEQVRKPNEDDSDLGYYEAAKQFMAKGEEYFNNEKTYEENISKSIAAQKESDLSSYLNATRDYNINESKFIAGSLYNGAEITDEDVEAYMGTLDFRDSADQTVLKILEEQGTTFEEWSKQFGEDAVSQARAMLELKQTYTKMEEAEAINLTEQEKGFINSLYNDIDELDQETLNKKLEMAKALFGKDSDQAKYVEKIINDKETEREGYIEDIATFLGQDSENLKKNMGDWSTSAIKVYQDSISKVIEEKGPEAAKRLHSQLQEIFNSSHLTPEQINNVLNFDWSNINTLNYKEYKDKFLEMCEELGIEGGQHLFEEVYSVNTLYGLTNLLDLTEEQIEERAKEIKEKVDSIWSAEGDFVTVISGARAGTALDVDTYLKIKEELESMGLNAEDYISIMEDGSIIVDNADGLEQIYENQLNTEYRQLEADKQKIKNAIKLLEIQKATLEAQLADPSIGGQDKSRIYKSLTDTDVSLQKYNDYISDIEKSQKQAQEDFKIKNKKFHDDLAAKTNEAKEKSKKAIEDTTKAVEDAQKKVQDALEKIAKAEQDVIDKTNELNEALYGNPLHKNKLDPLYNYNTQLEQFTKNATRAKEALSKMQPGDDAKSLINDFLTNTHGEFVNRRSQNEVIAASIANYRADLTSRLSAELASMNARYGASMSTNTSDYIYQNGNRVGINFQALNAAQLPDSISDYVEETVETINKLQDQIDDNVDEIKKKEQELRDMRKDALERRKALEDEVVKTLQEKAKEEIDTQKDKYDALKDADNDYLDALEDAIKRERDLRNKANEWDGLATKEKKLSLIQRDTSGANEKEVMKLENEVQNDREKLLDESIDDIINGMKEMYELQQESREIEIEYQEAMLENADTIKAATAIIEGWHTSDDLVAWFVENATKEFAEGSETTKEIMITEWQETGDQMVADTELLQTDIMSAAEVTQEQITTNIYNTSEILTSQSQLTLDTVLASTNDAIQKGQQALADAIASVQAARDEYTQAIAALREAEDAARQAQVDALALKGELEEQANKDALKIEWQNRYDSVSNQPARDEIARRAISELGSEYYWENNIIHRRYASGGLVDYTGPAWVDGTPSQPEAFLSAEDTQRIGEAAQLLADLPIFGGGSFNSTSITNGDSLIEVHINIENIASDVDLDNALDEMKSAIWEAANPAGSSVILSK